MMIKSLKEQAFSLGGCEVQRHIFIYFKFIKDKISSIFSQKTFLTFGALTLTHCKCIT